MRGALIGLCLMVLFGSAAGAQEARTWMFNFESDMAVLQYGLPDSDDAPLVIECEPAKKTMQITQSVGTGDLVPGRPVRIKFASAAASVEYPGQAVASETDGTINVEVMAAMDHKLIAVLKGGPTLTVDVAGSAQTIPLKDAAPHVAEFERACLRRK
jgi:hypothetical protein